MINYIKVHILWLLWLVLTGATSIKWFFRLERALDVCSPKYVLWLKRHSFIIYRYHTKSAYNRGNYISINDYTYINNIGSYEDDISSGWNHHGKVLIHQKSLKQSPVVMKFIIDYYPETVKYYSKEVQQLLEFYKI